MKQFFNPNAIGSLLVAWLVWGNPATALCGEKTLEEEAVDWARERENLRQASLKLCEELRKEPVHGVPTVQQMKRLGPLFTAGVRDAMEEARQYQAEQIRRYPDEKPMWIEGDLFSSSDEGVTSWEVREAFVAPGSDGEVQVRQAWLQPEEVPVAWTDIFVFKKSGDKWLLDDIQMGGEWALESGASLRGFLPGGGRDEVDHESLDERWRVTFTRDGEDVSGVSIAPKEKPDEKTTLFGGERDERCPMPTWVVWGPRCDMLAIRLGDSPRFTRTRVFRLEGDTWKAVELPGFYNEEKATMLSNGFVERDGLSDALYWRDANTLVLEYFGSFSKEDEGDGFHKFIAVRVEADGNARVLDAADVPAKR